MRIGERPSISTLDGLTSRCSTPTACTAMQRLGEAAAKAARSAPAIGPSSAHVVVQREPGHVAGGDVRHRAPRVGVDDLGDPRLRIRRSELTSRASRARASSSPTMCGRSTLSATRVPSGACGQVDDAHAALADAGRAACSRPTVRALERLGRGAARHGTERHRDRAVSRRRLGRSDDAVHPAEGVLGAAVLDVDQGLADRHA